MKTQYPAAEEELARWQQIVSKVFWKNPNELKQTYAHASILQNGRVVFNIKGNSHRLIADVDYEHSALYLKWFGTHDEYNNVNAQTVEYLPSRFNPT